MNRRLVLDFWSIRQNCCFLMRWKMRIWHQKDSLLNANSFCQRISDMFVSFSWIASQFSIFVNKQQEFSVLLYAEEAIVVWILSNRFGSPCTFWSNLCNGYFFYLALKASSSSIKSYFLYPIKFAIYFPSQCMQKKKSN